MLTFKKPAEAAFARSGAATSLCMPYVGQAALGAWSGKHVIGQIAGAAIAICVAQSSYAAAIYDNGPPDQQFGTQMSEFQVAENFTLAQNSNITNIRFWTIQDNRSDYSGSVYWAIYSNLGGQPGALVQGGVTASVAEAATGVTEVIPGYDQYVIDIAVAFALTSGDYWLGLHNGPLTSTDPTEMLWQATGVQVGSFGEYYDPAFGWTDTGNESAFLLDGSPVEPPPPPPPPPPPGVPEPGTGALLAAALLATRALRRKTR